VVLASPHSRGSLLLAHAVARRGLPVLAVPVGFAAWRLLPLADANGRWSPLAQAVPAASPAWFWWSGPRPSSVLK
jgi:hypothetical protein